MFKKVRNFSASDRIHIQAQQIWQILASMMISKNKLYLHDKKTITYGELAKAMGKSSQAGRTLSRQLWIVGEYCKDNNIPTLNSIVVNAQTGMPGHDVVLSDGNSISEEIEAVNKFNWAGVGTPSAGTFLKVWNSLSKNS